MGSKTPVLGSRGRFWVNCMLTLGFPIYVSYTPACSQIRAGQSSWILRRALAGGLGRQGGLPVTELIGLHTQEDFRVYDTSVMPRYMAYTADWNWWHLSNCNIIPLFHISLIHFQKVYGIMCWSPRLLLLTDRGHLAVASVIEIGKESLVSLLFVSSSRQYILAWSNLVCRFWWS